MPLAPNHATNLWSAFEATFRRFTLGGPFSMGSQLSFDRLGILDVATDSALGERMAPRLIGLDVIVDADDLARVYDRRRIGFVRQHVHGHLSIFVHDAIEFDPATDAPDWSGWIEARHDPFANRWKLAPGRECKGHGGTLIVTPPFRLALASSLRLREVELDGLIEALSSRAAVTPPPVTGVGPVEDDRPAPEMGTSASGRG